MFCLLQLNAMEAGTLVKNMKIDKRYKLDKISGDKRNAVRLPLQHVHVDATSTEKPVAVATNGAAMAVVPIEVSTEDDFEHEVNDENRNDNHTVNVPTSTFKALVKEPLSFLASSAAITTCTGVTYSLKKANRDKFPAWRQVVSSMDAGFVGTKVVKVGIDAKQLLNLAEALGTLEKGTAPVFLEIAIDNDGAPLRNAMKVTGAHTNDDAYGLLMPYVNPKG